MDRRRFLLSGIAFAAASSTSARAESNEPQRRYNFGSTFSRPARPRISYRGKQIVSYRTGQRPGTIIIDTGRRKLFYVMPGGKAIAYGVGVGRQGFQWTGTAQVGLKKTWPEWRPPKEMIERELKKYGRRLPDVVPGGPKNPLGARALYLFQGGRDTLYRIHGTNAPSSIGRAMSSGCIRMLNEEVIDLYNRTPVGAKVVVI